MRLEDGSSVIIPEASMLRMDNGLKIWENNMEYEEESSSFCRAITSRTARLQEKPTQGHAYLVL